MAKGTEPDGGDGAPKKAPGKEGGGGGGGEVPAAAGEEVVMRVPVHCDRCGRKLRRSLERLEWVGEVSVDSSTDTVVVRGPKAVENAAETVKIVERRTGRKVVLVSPAPLEKLPPAPAAVKETKKDDDGSKDVNDLPEINMKMVVILRMNLHCDACCEEMKRRILRIKGVEDAVPHLKSSQMMVKGVVEPATLVGFIHSCTGRNAAIFRAEPLDPLPPPPKSSPPPPPADQAADETKKEDTPPDTGEKKDAQDDNGKNEEPREEKKGGGDQKDNEEKPATGGGGGAEEHEHEEAHGGGEGEKHAAGRLFAAPLPAGVFTVAPPEMTMAISYVTPYHHYYYPSSSSYYPYAQPPYYYQCQYPQPYYPPYMYGYGDPPAETFTEENPNSCAIV